MFDRLAEFMEGLSGRRTFLQRTAMQALALMAAVVGFQRESKAGCGSPYQCCNLCAAPSGCSCDGDPSEMCHWQWNCGNENGNWLCFECIGLQHCNGNCNGGCDMCECALCSSISQIP
jgi:hypothetical protein